MSTQSDIKWYYKNTTPSLSVNDTYRPFFVDKYQGWVFVIRIYTI